MAALALVGRQLVTGFAELYDQALQGLGQVQHWLSDGPLHLTAGQIDKYVRTLPPPCRTTAAASSTVP